MRIIAVEPPLAHRDRPAGTEIQLIVMHATAGAERPDSSVQNAVDTLRDRGLAYHYLIAKDGSVYKCCPSLSQAGHAGSSYGPREAAQGLSRRQHPADRESVRKNRTLHFVAGCSVNEYSIGISFVNLNNGRDPYPPEQIAAAIALVGELRRAIPSLAWITTHFVVSPRRKSDPRGPGFDLDSFATETGLPVWRLPKP